ncbi:hypothetical protein C8R45DRAFT_1136385 [Mycena sanguinolenta]|nr:hypothetical protein C8R45DRAFT_1136385 [Mycena sanguinolenta]
MAMKSSRGARRNGVKRVGVVVDSIKIAFSGVGAQALRIDAREATSEFALAELLKLRRLDVFSGFGGAAPAATLLAAVSVGSTAQLPLEHLTIRIAFLGTLDDESFLRLDAALARLRAPQLSNVHILVSKTGIPWQGVSSARFVVMVQGLRALFPHLNVRGCLVLSCIDDGLQVDL